MSTRYSTYYIILIFIYIFFIRFPPVYFFGLKSLLLTSHSLATLILLIFFLVFIFEQKKHQNKFFKINKEDILILFFFLTQSASIIQATNIGIYYQRYWKILIGLLIYFTVKSYLRMLDGKSKEKFNSYLTKVLILGSLFALSFQFFIFFFPTLYFNFANYFIYGNVLDITKANYSSGKIFDDTYLEIIVPIILFYFLRKNKINYLRRSMSFVLLMALGFISFASNFRYRFLAFIFSTISLTFVFQKITKNLKTVFLLLIFIFFLFKISDTLLLNSFGYTVIDRVAIQSVTEDYNSIKWRFDMFQESIDMATKNFFGVGLGNFYDNVNNKQLSTQLGDRKNIAQSAIESGPHNIFFQYLAETGFLGLLSFCLLIFYFAIKDIRFLKGAKKNNIKKAYVVSFWSLMFIVQFFPAINLTFYSIFFLLRAMI